MAAKRSSRRLRGLAPEEDGLGVCLICQGNFSIEELQRLHRAVCCGTLFHRRCFKEMNARTSSCAACRFEQEPDNPRALELAEEDLESLIVDLDELPRFQILGNTRGMFETNRFQALVLEEINEYRCVGLPSAHRPGSPFWQVLPYFIPEHCFFTLLYAIETFTQLYVGSTMYLHGFVCLPVPVTRAVRQSFYEIFLANMPWAVYRLVESVRFRFLFHHNPFETSIRMSQLNVMPFGEETWYETDLPHYL